jgi:hypothetical protein
MEKLWSIFYRMLLVINAMYVRLYRTLSHELAPSIYCTRRYFPGSLVSPGTKVHEREAATDNCRSRTHIKTRLGDWWYIQDRTYKETRACHSKCLRAFLPFENYVFCLCRSGLDQLSRVYNINFGVDNLDILFGPPTLDIKTKRCQGKNASLCNVIIMYTASDYGNIACRRRTESAGHRWN